MKGELNSLSKLFEEDIKDIFDLHKSGISQVEIAEIYGVGKSQICSILKRDAWGHVIIS